MDSGWVCPLCHSTRLLWHCSNESCSWLRCHRCGAAVDAMTGRFYLQVRG